MNSTNCTSRELYNSLSEFEQFLVDQWYLTIIDWQMTMKPKEWFNQSLQQLKQQFTDKLKRDRKDLTKK